MDEKRFPGQQEGERILYFTRPHPLTRRLSFLRVLLFSFLIFLTFFMMDAVFGAGILRLVGIILGFLVVLVGWWWVKESFDNTGLYITDRRIVKFFSTAPFVKTTRTLFWDDAIKCKTFHRRPLLEKILGVGSIEVHAESQDRDNIDVDLLSYHEDLANYIEKILFLFKNRPNEVSSLKPFVAKPKGERD